MPDFSSVEKLDLSGKRVVVSGGTQGIGAGIALFAASLGATVAIIGRNPALGNALISNLASGDSASPKDHVFLSADLATIRGAKQAGKLVKDWAGDKNVDLLFQCQGGMPSATEIITEDGLEFHFAVQALSRFILPYTLAKLGALQDSTVLSIAGAGGGSDTIDLDHIDAEGLSLVAKVQNSAAIIDTFSKEFDKRYSYLRVLHTQPGFVSTNVMVNSKSAWYLRVMANIIMSIPFVSRTPDQYARVAMWLVTSEQVKQKKDVVNWSQHGTEARLSAVARDDKQRERVWEKLVSMVDDV